MKIHTRMGVLQREARTAVHFNHGVHFISSPLSFITSSVLIHLHKKAEEEEPAPNSLLIYMMSV